MTTEKRKCPVCQRHEVDVSDISAMVKISCPLCGHYRISEEQLRFIDFQVPRHLLSGVLRNAWDSTGIEFDVKSHLVNSLDALKKASPITIPGETDILTKADIILRYLRTKSTYPGEGITLVGQYDYSIAYCKTPQEFTYCREHLSSCKLIEQDRSTQPSFSFRITPAGWAYLSGVGSDTKEQGFIAMAFGLENSNALHTDGHIPGIRNAGYNPMRIDRKDHNNRIDDEIVAEIRKSKFVVADLTGKNAGAYFEAGFAMGLGKPVIWTCAQADIDKKDGVHFDTRQYSIVPWEPDNLADFAKRLMQRIEATIGHGKYVAEPETK